MNGPKLKVLRQEVQVKATKCTGHCPGKCVRQPAAHRLAHTPKTAAPPVFAQRRQRVQKPEALLFTNRKSSDDRCGSQDQSHLKLQHV